MTGLMKQGQLLKTFHEIREGRGVQKHMRGSFIERDNERQSGAVKRVGSGGRRGFESCLFYTQPLFPEGLFCAEAVLGTRNPAVKKKKVLECLVALSVPWGKTIIVKSITAVL